MPMRALLAVLLLLAALPARAEMPQMAAVGVLERDGRTDCSAVLIAPDLVLTAAHCVASRKLVAEGGESRIHFRTGAYPGRPSVSREAVRRMLHPIFLAGDRLPGNPTVADLALLALSEPVPGGAARPVPLGAPVAAGERVVVASFPGGRGLRARERICPAREGDATIAWLSCLVVPGESGGAVLRLTPEGPELAALLVASTREDGTPAAIAVQIETRLRQLQAVYGLPAP